MGESDFIPSTFFLSPTSIPEYSLWRLVPYSLSLDVANGGGTLNYSPTWYIGKNDIDSIEGKLRLYLSTNSADRDVSFFEVGNYFNFTKSSWSLGAGIQYDLKDLEDSNRWTWGPSVRYSILDNILYAEFMHRFHYTGTKTHLFFGINDLPGLFYWFQR